jgi:hypothetical protein
VCALSPHNLLLAVLVRVFDTFKDVRMTLGIAPLRTPVRLSRVLIFSELMTGHRQARVARGAELCAGVQPGMHYASFFCLGRKPLSSATCLQFL